jgi:hypothetical protein
LIFAILGEGMPKYMKIADKKISQNAPGKLQKQNRTEAADIARWREQ